MTVIASERSDKDTAWLNHGVGLGALICLIVAEFHGALVAALQVWVISPTYSHCFLIIPIVAWLIWEKRDALKATRPVIAPRFLWLVPPLLLVWWLGELSAINEVRQYAVIALIQVSVIVVLGVGVLRVIWFPTLFLLFLVPTGEYLILPMQQFATRFVDISLNLLGIPHFTEGTTFELTNGRFEVAEACAGLRFLIATVTLGVLFSYLMFQKIYKIVLFMVCAIVVPLIGNGLRCVGIILLAHFTNNAYGVGADHLIYGWGFNVAILLVLMFIGSQFRDDIRRSTITPEQTPGRDTPAGLRVVVAIAALSISCGPALAWWRDTKSALPDVSSVANLLRSDEWRQETGGNWRPNFPGADAQIIMTRTDASSVTPVDLFVAYYARPRAGHTMTAHVDQAWDGKIWNPSATARTAATLAGRSVPLQESLIDSGAEQRLVWSSYWVNGRFTLSELSVRLLQAEAALEGHESQAFIAVSTPVNGPVDDARERLARAISRLDGLPAAINRVNSPAITTPDGAR